ncbi:MAG: hypothetical protein ACREMH_00145 [Gemmatimonadales bacterium]
MPNRPTPFDLVFGRLADARFPAVREALRAAGTDVLDRDAFLMARTVLEAVRDLLPEDGLGEGIGELAALVHHGWLHWDAGLPTMSVSPEALDLLLTQAPAEAPDPRARYVQLPLGRVWAETIPGEAAEPLDGCFLHLTRAGEVRVLGIFGLHPGRDGFTVVEAQGPRPDELVRSDGTATWSPTLQGGAAAGLYSLAGGEELLELGWRLASVSR